MARCDRATRWGRGALTAIATLIGALVLVPPARATMKYGPIQLSGSIDTQNLFRASEIDQWQFVQDRNTALVRLDYDWLENGKLIDRIEVPYVKSSKLYLLYRGVYDGFWGIAPGGRQKGVTTFDDLVGGPIIGNQIGNQVVDGRVCNPLTDPGCASADAHAQNGLYSSINSSGRYGKAFDNTLREAYIDLSLADAPISFRLGRQQVIWGESDQFRLMDIINPLDTTWHLQQEEWDKLRIPLWLVKTIWDMGDIGPIANAFTEVVWNPGDFYPGNVVDFLPAPWAVGIPNPVRAGQIQLPDPNSNLMFSPQFNLQGTTLRRGNFTRDPANASDIGVRFHGVTDIPLIHMQGFEFTANYLYARGRGIGAVAAAPFALKIDKVVVDPSQSIRQNPADPASPLATFAGNAVAPANVTAEWDYPYTHTFGTTANWFEGNYTNAVFRLETAYQLGAPFQSASISDRVPILQPNGHPYKGLFAPLGETKRDVWAGMLGFDRPTWIKFLNPRTTWFITGQFFWSYVNGPHSDLRGGVLTAAENPYFTPPQANPLSATTKNGVGQWDNGQFAGQIERTQTSCTGYAKTSPNSPCLPSSGFANTLYGNADKFEQWELLSTLAATSFYLGGTVVPFFAIAVDPVNRGFLAQLKCDFFLTNNLIIQPQAKFFNDLGSGRPSLDPWGVGQLGRRDEVGGKITYQF